MATLADNSVVARLQSEQYKKDERINSLLEKLINDTQELEENVPANKKYDIILATEYLLTRLRFVVADELIKVEHALVIENNEVAVKAYFTKRKSYLMIVNQRLLEIREDLNVLSRMTYNRF